MFATTLHRSAAALLAAGALIAACGGSDDDAEPAADEPAEAPADDGSSDNASDDSDSGGGDAGATDTIGNGVLRIDGVESTGFSGDCEISRGFGGEDVGDVSVEGLSVIVAIDNVDESNPDIENDLNFVMINERQFRVINEGGDIESITEIGSRSSDGSRDYVTIRFAGTLNDGRAVEADVYCELQNQF